MNKINKFIKLGAVSVLAAMSLNTYAHTTDVGQYPKTYEAESHQVQSQNVTNKFSVENFAKKYQLNLEKINIIPIYLKKGLPVKWNQSTAVPNPGGTVNVILVLDSKGDLYKVDEDFAGKDKLTQKEKDGLREQTALHEVAHAYSYLDKDLFKSSKLSEYENSIVNDMIMPRYSRMGIRNVYDESRAEAYANALYIKGNSSNIIQTKKLLTKINHWEKDTRDAIINKGNFDSHLMMGDTELQTIKDMNKFVNMTNEEISEYSKVLASDMTLNYFSKYGKKYKVLDNLNETQIKSSLMEHIVDIVRNDSTLKPVSSNFFYNQSQKIINSNPLLKDEDKVDYLSSYNQNEEQKIINDSARVFPESEQKLKIYNTTTEEKILSENFEKMVQEINNSVEFQLAKNIISDYVNKGTYLSEENKLTGQVIPNINKNMVKNNISSLRQTMTSNKSTVQNKL